MMEQDPERADEREDDGDGPAMPITYSSEPPPLTQTSFDDVTLEEAVVPTDVPGEEMHVSLEVVEEDATPEQRAGWARLWKGVLGR